MGLGLLVSGKARSARSARAALDLAEQSALRYFSIQPHQVTRTKTPERKQRRLVSAYGAGAPIVLTAQSSGVLEVDASTSAAGPGYHRDVVEWLDVMEKESGFQWAVSEETDETDYIRTRDFASLQASMLKWLRTLCKYVLFSPPSEGGSMQLSLPLSDRNLSGRGTIMTPLGPRDLAWAERVSRGEGGEDFFPWWESGRGVRSMVGELNAELWVRTPMRSPLTDAEKAQLQSIFKRSSAIVKLGGADYLPWRTLADLAADSEYAREFGERAATSIDRHSPIGYLRGDATFSFGRWTLRFSASATNPCPEEPEVDERSARYADNTHMIWTLVVDPPEGVHSADDMRARSYYSGLDGNVRWSGDGFEANARSLTLPLNDPELPEYHKLDAQFFGSGHAMILIIDSLHASGRDRAMEIAQSVRLKAAPNER